MSNIYSNFNLKKVITIVAICFVVLVTFFSSFTFVPSGYTGVRTTFGQISEEGASGFTWKIPFVQHIEKVNNKYQDIFYKDRIWSETNERTVIFAEDIEITYNIVPEKSAWIYANVTAYKDALISDSMIASSVKTALVQLGDQEATNRGIVEPLVVKTLQQTVDLKYGPGVVYIKSVAMGNIDFEDSYNQAIAAKQEAKLAYEKQQVENQRAIEQAEAEAEVKRINAQGEADAKKTSAEGEAEAIRILADAEAEANKKIAASLTDAILDKMYYDTWNGILPSVYGTDGTIITMPGENSDN